MDNVNTSKFVYIRKLIFHFPELPYLLLVASCLLFFAESCLAQPTAVINVGSHQNVGYTVCFDGSQSYGDNHDIHQIAYYSWNFGDGSREDGEYLNTHTHVFDSPGTYLVTLTVTDYRGEVGVSFTNISVGALPSVTVSGHSGSAIQSAISSLGGQPGIIKIPAGNYAITSQISIPSGVIIEGAGANNTILTCTANGFIAGGNNIRITGIQFTSNEDYEAIIVAGKNNAYVDHCEIHDFHHGGAVSRTGSATFEYNNIYSCNVGWAYGIMVTKDAYSMIRYNEFSNNRHSVTGSGDNVNVMNTGFDFLHNHIEYDNELTLGPVAPVDMHSGGHGRIRVCDNVIENVHYGVSFRDGWGEVKRNTFRNVTGYIIRFSPPYAINRSSFVGDGVNNMYFDNNTIINSNNRYWLQWGTECYINCRRIDDLVPFYDIISWNNCEATLNIMSSTLPTGSISEVYTFGLQATSGSPPYVWRIIDGDLPDGLSMNSSGIISGLPNVAGQKFFTVQATDANDVSANKQLSITINDSSAPQETDSDVLQTGSTVIDGNLVEFSDASGVSFSDDSGRGSGLDNSALVKTMWDDTHLYIGIDVTDTQLNAVYDEADKTSGLWRDDCVEIFIDPDNDGGATTSNDDYRYTISIKEIVLDGSGFTGWSWDGHIVKKVGLKGTLNFNDDTDHGYTIEVAIPWTDLGIFPAVGKIFGLQIGVIDRDAESDYEYFGWPIHDSSFNNPDGWAKVRLASSSSSGTNRPPVLSDFTASPPGSDNPGEEIIYRIIANDPDGDSLTYSVDFGDRTSSRTGNVVRHEYATSGTYTARATIDDDHGHTVTKTLQITVEDLLPAAPINIDVH